MGPRIGIPLLVFLLVLLVFSPPTTTLLANLLRVSPSAVHVLVVQSFGVALVVAILLAMEGKTEPRLPDTIHLPSLASSPPPMVPLARPVSNQGESNH